MQAFQRRLFDILALTEICLDYWIYLVQPKDYMKWFEFSNSFQKHSEFWEAVKHDRLLEFVSPAAIPKITK